MQQFSDRSSVWFAVLATRRSHRFHILISSRRCTANGIGAVKLQWDINAICGTRHVLQKASNVHNYAVSSETFNVAYCSILTHAMVCCVSYETISPIWYSRTFSTMYCEWHWCGDWSCSEISTQCLWISISIFIGWRHALQKGSNVKFGGGWSITIKIVCRFPASCPWLDSLFAQTEVLYIFKLNAWS